MKIKKGVTTKIIDDDGSINVFGNDELTAGNRNSIVKTWVKAAIARQGRKK